MKQQEKINEIIISIVKLENNRPIPPGILVKKIHQQFGSYPKKIIYDTIDTLIADKQLKLLPNKKIVIGYTNEKILSNVNLEGIISLNQQGDGYIKEISDKNIVKEWFVHSSNLNGALDGDSIIFHPMEKFSFNQIQNAVVKKVITRKQTDFVGTYKKTKDGYQIILNNPKNYYAIKLKDTNNLLDGHKILVRIKEFNQETKIANAIVICIFGHEKDIDADILSIVYENGINPMFDHQIEEAIKNYQINETFLKNRKDLKSRNYITIDPSTAKDLDDAVYVKKYEQYFLLSVAIADVATYVPFESKLDQIALKRGTSIYLADRVIPMLPHKIADDWCSLNPLEEKLTMTVDMEIDFIGNIKKINVYPSKIIIKKRFSYDEVNNYLNDQTINDQNIDKAIYAQLNEANTLHQILRKKMIKNGYLDFNLKEPIVILNSKTNEVETIKFKTTGEAQKMIEDFMVSANQAITIKAHELNLPFIYRVHPQPSLEKLNQLLVEAKKMNFFIDPKVFNHITTKDIHSWIEKNTKENNSFKNELIKKLILRTMEKATYQIQNTHHFGLALKYYTHFTSPIRRYPDLIIQRIYWMYVFAPNYYSHQQRKHLENELKNICNTATNLEIRAIKTEREVNALKFAQYMSKHINQVYDGVISAITNFGIFVEICENGIEGLVRIKNLHGDYFEYNQNNYTIIGKKTNKIFTFGDLVKVRVNDVDINNRQINLTILGYEEKTKLINISD